MFAVRDALQRRRVFARGDGGYTVGRLALTGDDNREIAHTIAVDEQVQYDQPRDPRRDAGVIRTRRYCPLAE